MLVPLAVAATVLASPAPLATASQLPKGAVLLVLRFEDPPPALPRAPDTTDGEPRPDTFLRGLVDRFAVVKPHRRGPDAPPSLQMFVLVTPMKGQVGVHAVGSF
jgi:hypothetical protein